MAEALTGSRLGRFPEGPGTAAFGPRRTQPQPEPMGVAWRHPRPLDGLDLSAPFVKILITVIY